MASDVSSSAVIREVNLVGGKLLQVYFTEASGVDDTDYFSIDMASYGGRLLKGVLGFIHTTEHSIVAAEQPTTAVSTTTVTVTIGGSTDNKARYYEIMFW
uniref:Uncharacterized protein n=1 Tax=viral metagenome TaxID=1070528 RepID=A0A6M3LA95_9ZZZZ